jgi:hypothetical protein
MRKPEPFGHAGVLEDVRLRLGLVLVLGLWLGPKVHAQDAELATDPELDAFRRMVDSDPFVGEGDDPLARDARDDEMRTMSLPGPNDVVGSRVPVRAGEVLTAIAGVRETSHRVRFTLRDGLVLVHEEMHFENRARVPAEVRYRLSVPEGATVFGFSACQSGNCADRDAAPTVQAEGIRDERGFAIEVRAAPITPRGEAQIVHVHWALRTPVRGGQIRFVLPPRGNDARIVPMELSVQAIDLVMPTVAGRPIESRHEVHPPNSPIVIEAFLPMTAELSATGFTVPCDRGRCARLRVVAPRPEIDAGDVIVAIDASPSTAVAARGRIAPAVRALLSILPPDARVRVVVFASRAFEMSHGWSSPEQIAALSLESAVEQDLGPATRFESLWREARPWAVRGVRLVMVGDGGLTESEAARAAFEAASEEGVLIRSINVADRVTTAPLRTAIERARGIAIDVGIEAEQASGQDRQALIARLMSLVATTSAERVSVLLGSRRIELGPLASGEEIVWEGPIETGQRAALEVDGIQYGARSSEAEVVSAIRSLAEVERMRGGSSPAVSRSGLPPETLLYSLRRRVMPAARACFRDDRRGRATHQVRAVMRLELADREITAADVDGSISEELRQCLLAALDRVEVPSFDGRVRANWPLYTEARMALPVLELWRDVADEVDRAMP